MTSTLRLAEQLIACHSPTPLDGGCMEIVTSRLAPLGFVATSLPFEDVKNVWIKRQGTGIHAKTLVFAGHTDVVPTGPLDQWTSPPFEPAIRDGKLFGRGASDMKTSIAAFVVAVEEFLKTCPQPNHSIALLLTSDEEGPSINGTVKVCEWLKAKGERLDYCIVGEPTSIDQCGDMIKNGRRGSLNGKLHIKGIQAHIGYPQLGRNPIHLAMPALAELVAKKWDDGNAYFEPTQFQISNIHGGVGATNIIPNSCVVDFNFRFCTESTSNGLQAILDKTLRASGLDNDDYTIDWTLSGQPFITPVGNLVQAAREAIKATSGIDTVLSTTGGTSDGRFISQICEQVIELGPTNATIHKINEHVPLADIEPLKNIYLGVIERLVA